MTRRTHLMLDGIGQAGIMLYYAFILSKSDETITLLQLFIITMATWQFINGILSYKFFEGQSKKQYVRISGIAWLAVIVLLGFVFLAGNFIMMLGFAAFGEIFETIFSMITSAIWMSFPILLGISVCWYIYITIQDINIIINKTI